MLWTIRGLVVLLLLSYAAWFTLLLRHRLGTPELRGLPLSQRMRQLGLDVLLLPLVVVATGQSSGQLAALLITLPTALAIWTFAPRYVTSKVLPISLVLLGLFGFVMLRDYLAFSSRPINYGVLSASIEASPQYALYPEFVILQAYAFLTAGLWWLWRRIDKAGPAARLLWEPAKGKNAGQLGRPRWGLLLLGVLFGWIEMLGRSFWLDTLWWTHTQTLVVVAAAVLLVARFPAVAADVALAGMIFFGLYGVALGFAWPAHVPLPSPYSDFVRYGLVLVDSRTSAVLAGVEGLALTGLGVWLVPRAVDDKIRALFRSASDAELATRVVKLTRTRADAVDTASAELRRLERDLHDGAQARLVALGMSLRAAERLIIVNPLAAAELVAEAREMSAKVLDELRDLVRGICPPVLADRGLGDAVQALALDTPLRTDVVVELPERPELPVETACYFAVAEVLANAVKHAGARNVQVRIWHADRSLRITVTDDGAGGADPQGSGLRGLERRLGALDGVLAVNSPAGGPTIIAIEVPCTLTSQHTAMSRR